MLIITDWSVLLAMGAIVAWSEFDSPIGPIRIYGWSRGLLALALPESDRVLLESRMERQLRADGWEIVFRHGDEALLLDAVRQLVEYFAGHRERFDLPLDLWGTPFRRRVWELVREIPFGETRSYGALARGLGCPGAARAVGAAVAANPLPIVVPCHRVVGARGELVGYAGGHTLKAQLLAHELPTRLART